MRVCAHGYIIIENNDSFMFEYWFYTTATCKSHHVMAVS